MGPGTGELVLIGALVLAAATVALAVGVVAGIGGCVIMLANTQSERSLMEQFIPSTIDMV